jgi:N-acetyl-anhydromuramyl-L-alanine amidase AmpD
MPEPRIFTTSDWNARRIVDTFTPRPALGIVLHHAVLPNRAPLPPELERDYAFQIARGIQRSHIDEKHWADSGQHFTISRGGLLLEGRTGTLREALRGNVVQGAHATDLVANQRWFGIELEGTYHERLDTTQPQLDALVELCAWLSYWGEFPPTQIEGHRHFKPDTDCPGLLLDYLPTLRDAAGRRRAQLPS